MLVLLVSRQQRPRTYRSIETNTTVDWNSLPEEVAIAPTLDLFLTIQMAATPHPHPTALLFFLSFQKAKNRRRKSHAFDAYHTNLTAFDCVCIAQVMFSPLTLVWLGGEVGGGLNPEKD